MGTWQHGSRHQIHGKQGKAEETRGRESNNTDSIVVLWGLGCVNVVKCLERAWHAIHASLVTRNNERGSLWRGTSGLEASGL